MNIFDVDALLTFYGLMLIGSFVNLKVTGQKPTMPGCQRIPQRNHVELVANRKHGFEKGPGLYALYRGLCLIRCAPLEIIVPWQEEISGAATAGKGKGWDLNGWDGRRSRNEERVRNEGRDS